MSPFDFFFIFGAKYLYLLIIAIAGVCFLFLPRLLQKQMVALAFLAVPLVYLLTILSAHFYYDPRPFVLGHFTPLVPHDSDNGFPSDHVLLTGSIAALFYPFRKKWSYSFFVLTIIVAISRVYVGVHHITDIVGSAVIVGVAVGLAWFLLKKAEQRFNPVWIQ